MKFRRFEHAKELRLLLAIVLLGVTASVVMLNCSGTPPNANTSSSGGSTSNGGAASLGGLTGTSGASNAGDSVLQRQNDAKRDGLYIQPTLTKVKAAAMHRDTSLSATIQGNVYAQPLYVQNGPGGKGIFIVVTESNNVHAVSETDGSSVWTKNLGTPAGASGAGCGNIAPLGITGTPAIDLPSRTLFLSAVVGSATTIQTHQIHALSIDDGSEKTGYPVDVSKLSSGSTAFDPVVQNQRGAALIANGTLYVPYGGHAGDCGQYHGWIVAVPLTNPAGAQAWATGAKAGGIWAVGGACSDGTDVFAATGNTYTIGQAPPNNWEQGDAVLRFKGLATYSNQAVDYFTPSNWQALDQSDGDLGGTGPIIVDVSGATPSALVVALGKNGVAYLLNRANLGGKGTGNGTTGEGVQSAKVASNTIMNAATTYTTANGTYVAFNTTGAGVGCPTGQSGNLVALKIGATSPPTMGVAWCVDNQGRGSPMTTTTDGKSEAIVWAVGATSSNKLHGFDGDTGAVVYSGGGTGDTVAGVHYFNSPIAAKGRIIVAGNNALYAFNSP